jgi:hypothetical protein
VRGAGAHAVHWDGRTERGKELPSGAYFARLRANGRKEVRRVVLAR